MWQAIKADLQDFLTTASSEGEAALNQLDRTMDDWDATLPGGDAAASSNDVGLPKDAAVKQGKGVEGCNVSLFHDANDFLLQAEDEDGEEDGNGYGETPEEEAQRLCGLQETFIEPLFVEADCFNDSNQNRTSYNDDDNEEDVDENEQEAIDLKQQLFEQQQLQNFLKSFDIEAHSQEISQLLHPLLPLAPPTAPIGDDNTDEPTQLQASETQDIVARSDEEATQSHLTPLQKHYQTLVLHPQEQQQQQHPTITHKQFWTRYYYRCNPPLIAQRRQHLHRLQQQQQQQSQDTDRILQEVSHAALQIGKSAASLLHSGWWADVASNVEKVMEGSSSFHYQPSGRPPFVRIAGEEDDDEYYEDEEEEDGDGWGSHSDSEDAPPNNVNDHNEDEDDDESIHDEVDFVEGQTTSSSSPLSPLKLESLDVVKLRRTLMQAEHERNNVMAMVEERNEEIARLNCMLLERRRQKMSGSESCEVEELQKEVERWRNIVAVTKAHATVCELKVKIDAIKGTSNYSMESFDSLIQEEHSKQVVLQKELDEYREKIQEIERQKQMADERIAQLMLRSDELSKKDT
eukprot:CCRYP_005122-RA/>CCRYP_005122-RA protein AED:0.05 eAED:0.05 QI:0/-1/0/1/-1/1/1/0/573